MKKRLVYGLSLSVLAIGLVSPKLLGAAVTISSADIVPADGTSGQVLTTGDGVKTGHIQNLAVTSAKIAAGTIATGNIGSSQITNPLLAPNAVTTDKILDGTVGTADLANGAVNDAKLTGPISASKISSTGLNADTVDGKHAADLAPVVHTHSQADVIGLATALAGKASVAHDHDSEYQKKYANVIVVAKSGGDFTDPITAMNSILNASAANPYLVKIMPGVYDLGARTLVMIEYVDVEGSGENATVLTSSVSGGFFPVTSTVSGANNSELRLLTVTNTALSGLGVAISNFNSSPKLTHLTAAVSGSPAYASAIWNDHSSPTMNDVTASVTGATSDMYAVYNMESSPFMTNVNALASGASYSAFGVVNVTNSSPVMTNVKAIAQGASNYNYGVSNSASSVVMRGVTATASGGGTWNKGIENDGCSVVMTDVVATAAGGKWCAAINNHVSIADMTNVTATASGATGVAWGILAEYGTNKMTNVIATGSYGLNYQVDDNSQILIDRSTFEGGSLGIVSYGGTIKLGASKIVNGVGGGNGTFICVNSYDGNFAPLDDTCR